MAFNDILENSEDISYYGITRFADLLNMCEASVVSALKEFKNRHEELIYVWARFIVDNGLSNGISFDSLSQDYWPGSIFYLRDSNRGFISFLPPIPGVADTAGDIRFFCGAPITFTVPYANTINTINFFGTIVPRVDEISFIYSSTELAGLPLTAIDE